MHLISDISDKKKKESFFLSKYWIERNVWTFYDNLVRRQRPLNDVAWIWCGRCLLPLFLSLSFFLFLFFSPLCPSFFLHRSPATPRIFGAWCRDQIGSTCCTNVKVEAVKEYAGEDIERILKPMARRIETKRM